MAEPICTAIIPEKAVLIGLITSKQDENSVREYLDELSFLVDVLNKGKNPERLRLEFC